MKTPVAYFGIEELKEWLSNIELLVLSETINEKYFKEMIEKINELIFESISELNLELDKIS